VQVCGLTAGAYTVSESVSGSAVVGLSVNGVSVPPDSVYSFTWTAGKPDTLIVFQNVILIVG